MPTMVMSSLPKGSQATVSARRKLKGNKHDHILLVNYMFVGAPKRKLAFYVRERLVYRSNVEVSFEEVFEYLTDVCSDPSISLHYTVNNQYVPITTTGQLHTFFQNLHADPNMFLYIENKDYVWNVKPTNKKKRSEHGMERKKKCQCPADADGNPVENCEMNDVEEEDEDEDEEEEEDSTVDEEEDDVVSNTDSELNEQLDDEEEEVEDEQQVGEEGEVDGSMDDEYETSEDFSDTDEHEVKARMKTEMGECLADARVIMESLVDDAEVFEKEYPPAEWVTEMLRQMGIEDDSDDEIEMVAEAKPRMKKAAEIQIPPEVFRFVKEVLKEYNFYEYTQKSLAASCDKISEFLVEKYWPGGRTKESGYIKYAEELRYSIGVSLCKYFQSSHLSKTVPEHVAFESFIEDICYEVFFTHETHQRLETAQKLTATLRKLKENCENVNWEKKKVPSHASLSKTIKSLGKALKYFFARLGSESTSNNCNCVKNLQAYLEFLEIMRNTLEKLAVNRETTSLEGFKAIVNDIHGRTGNYTCNDGKGCKEHHGWEDMTQLSIAGKNKMIARMVETAKVALGRTPVFNENGEMCTAEEVKRGAGSRGNATQTIIKTTVTADGVATSTTTTRTGGGAQQKTTTTTTTTTTSGTKMTGKPITAELRAKIDAMYKSLPPPHNYVYPPAPKAGAILIPTGGLAHCRCRKDCPETVNEPAYEYMERFNEPRQPVWEKTKQKRFKKN